MTGRDSRRRPCELVALTVHGEYLCVCGERFRGIFAAMDHLLSVDLETHAAEARLVESGR